MSRVITILFIISSVFVMGQCQEKSETKKMLEDDIKSTKDEIARIKKENEKLDNQIKEEGKQYESKIQVSKELEKRGNEENRAQYKVIQELWQQLSKLGAEKKQLEEAPQNSKKLKLAIRVMNENIKTFDERRKNGMAAQCLELEGMANNGTQKHQSSVLADMEIEDTIVQQNELMMLKSQLTIVKNRNMELKMKLKSQRDYYELCIKNLNKEIERIGKDGEKAQESVDRLKIAIEVKKKEIDDIMHKSGDSIVELDKWKKEAKKVLDKYQPYAIEAECYEKMYGEVVTFAAANLY